MQQSGFVWGNGLYQPGGFYFSGFRKAQEIQILGSPFASKAFREKIEHERTRGGGQNKIKTGIERSIFCQFLANFRVLGPPSKKSKCHNSINMQKLLVQGKQTVHKIVQ